MYICFLPSFPFFQRTTSLSLSISVVAAGGGAACAASFASARESLTDSAGAAGFLSVGQKQERGSRKRAVQTRVEKGRKENRLERGCCCMLLRYSL